MLKKLATVLIAAGLVLIASVAWAQESPVAMLQSVSDRLISDLNNNKASLKDPATVDRIVRRILLPHVDTAGMARSVLRRDVWQKASDSERSEFITEFTKLIIRTYGAALSEYTDEKPEYYPIRGGYEGKPRVKVFSKIMRRGAPPVPMSYRLVRVGSDWMIYDFSVDGISIINSYRPQFANKLAKGSLSNLIAELRSHNKGR